MIYKNDDYRAVLAMEADRTGNYGMSYDDFDRSYDDCGMYWGGCGTSCGDGYDVQGCGGSYGYGKSGYGGGCGGYEPYGGCGEYDDIYDSDIKKCPVCGALYPEKFYIDDDEECIGCDICIHEVDELY